MRTGVRSKRCARCGQSRTEDEFWASRSTADGLQSWCRPCFVEYGRGYRERNSTGAQGGRSRAARGPRRSLTQARQDDSNRVRWCPRGQHLVRREDFYSNRRMASGLTVYCKACTRDYQRQRYELRTAALPLHRWTRRYVIAEYFDSIASAEQAYILGLYAADGWVASRAPCVGIELARHDETLLMFVRDQIAPGAAISWRSRTLDVGGQVRVYASGTLQVTSAALAVGLLRHGITPRKSLTLQWPEHLSDEVLRLFLLGYFDGDGCATWSRGGSRPRERRWVLLGTEAFLRGAVAFIERGTGIRLASPAAMGSRNVYRIVRGGEGARVIDAWLHEGHTLGLARKRI